MCIYTGYYIYWILYILDIMLLSFTCGLPQTYENTEGNVFITIVSTHAEWCHSMLPDVSCSNYASIYTYMYNTCTCIIHVHVVYTCIIHVHVVYTCIIACAHSCIECVSNFVTQHPSGLERWWACVHVDRRISNWLSSLMEFLEDTIFLITIEYF